MRINMMTIEKFGFVIIGSVDPILLPQSPMFYGMYYAIHIDKKGFYIT